MEIKIKLSNSLESVIVDKKVYDEFLTKDPHLVEINFVNILRLHSSGCCVFQKTWTLPNKGGYRTETIYLHKLIAEKYLANTKSDSNKLVGAINGNKLDCRLENLLYRSRSVASRQRKSSSRSGYTGVYYENNKYRAVISVNNRSLHIGMYDTAEEAASAYNQKSKEIYGTEGKFNKIYSKS